VSALDTSLTFTVVAFAIGWNLECGCCGEPIASTRKVKERGGAAYSSSRRKLPRIMR
jgi:hypothetical protein